jgi:hypothetical protein
MWRSLSFRKYVGSSSALDFPQIGFCCVLAPKGSTGVGAGVVACRAGRGLLRVDHASSHSFVASIWAKHVLHGMRTSRSVNSVA